MQAQLGQRRDRMNDAARARSHQEMADLRRRRNELAEWIGGMCHGPADAWNEVKAGFVRSCHDLEQAVRKAQAQFEREEPGVPMDDESSATKLQEQER